MAIFRNRRIVLRMLGVLVVLTLLVGLLVPAIPANVQSTWEAFYCQNCGIHKYVTETHDWHGALLESESSLEASKLSDWVEEHYPSPCNHVWQRNDYHSRGYCVVGPLRIRAGGGRYSSGPTPWLVSLYDEERRDLDRRYATDKEACRAYIAAALKRETPNGRSTD